MTGVVTVDAPKRRNDDGANPGSISGTCHREKACKKTLTHLQVKRGRYQSQTHKSHPYQPNLKSVGGAVPVGRRLHAPEAESFFDMWSSGLRILWARDTKLGTRVHLGKAYLAPYDLMGWGAVCTCSARASIVHLLLLWRLYRPNGGHRWCQTCRTHAYCLHVCAFEATVPVGCRLRAP